MSLETRLSALITAIGADIKALQAASGGSSDPFRTKMRKVIECYSEFLGDFGDLVSNYSGTGTNVSILTTAGPSADAYGIALLSTGSDAAGRAALRSQLDQYIFGLGKMEFASKVYMNAINDASNRAPVRIGWGDNDFADHVDGVYFEYDGTVSANWLCKTAGSSTRTSVDSGVAVGALSWYTLAIEVNAAGTEAKYYINGTLVATITTNIPTNFSFQKTSHGAWIVKTLGTTARFVYIDYIAMRIDRTTQR